MKKTIVVINGRGGCGKDTICEIAAKYCRVRNVSSITPIKDLASHAGWNGEKDPKSRKMLADLKQLFTEYNDLCNSYILSEAREFLAADEELMFVHIREGSEIEKFVNSARELLTSLGQADSCDCKTLLVSRVTEGYSNEALGNAADDCVNDYGYDLHYENSASTLEYLEKDFAEYLKNILIKR